MDTAGKVIKCKAAVAWKLNEPLKIEDIEVDPPKKGEVRVKIVASGVCHSDLSAQNGTLTVNFPAVLGHEGAGVVESIGDEVTYVKPGDHVLTVFIPNCQKCYYCQNYPNHNCCKLTSTIFSGKMLDGSSRLHCKGVDLSTLVGISSFAEYSVIPESSLCKISSEVPLDRACLLACGVGTGYGSAIKTAQVTPGSTCAVWGLGGIGLSAVLGCKKAGAKRIIGIDLNPLKEEKARILETTEFVNPKDHTRPVPEIIKEMTDEGAHFTFECSGNIKALKDAIESSHPGMGTIAVVGIPPGNHLLELHPMTLISGRKLVGSFYGSLQSKEDVPALVQNFMDKELPLDEFVTDIMPLDKVEEAFDKMKQGKGIRTVLNIAGN